MFVHKHSFEELPVAKASLSFSLGESFAADFLSILSP